MNADQILNLKVVEIARGSTVGKVSGVLIDAESRQVVALVLSGGTFGSTRYVPFQSIRSLQNDVATIPSVDSIVHRSSYRSHGMLDSLTGRKVLTEDGIDLGEVRSYSIDTKSGEITSITFGRTGGFLGGILGTGRDYETPSDTIKVLGDHVVVDNSVPDAVGYHKAA